ncbi:MAG: hypothetical protein HUU60_01425 [Armatimonadetes bacterium]|nr:hypothetical protein [Armatimonadota bacterium]
MSESQIKWQRLGVCAFNDKSIYLAEIVESWGVPAHVFIPEQLTAQLRNLDLLITAGYRALADFERAAIAEFMRRGGYWISVGSACGCEGLFGVEGSGSGLGDGYVSAGAFGDSALKFFGGEAVRATDATELATVLDRHQSATGVSGITFREWDKGGAVLFAVDVCRSVQRIQQGAWTIEDGTNPGDGSANVEDGVVRMDDGIVLDWVFDRDGGDPPMFGLPVADLWKDALLKAVLHVVDKRGGALPMIWRYPRNLDAVGSLSLDCQGEGPEAVLLCLHLLSLVGARASWCIAPPGMSLNIYRDLIRRDHDVSLLYDLDHPGGIGEPGLHVQREHLRRSAGQPELLGARTVGLRSLGHLDQTALFDKMRFRLDLGRGGYYGGTSGFAFGSCRLSRSTTRNGRMTKVYALPLTASNIGDSVPFSIAYRTIDACLEHEGIAHISARPSICAHSKSAEEIRRIVNHGRLKGMEWMTPADLLRWEEARRGIEFGLEKSELTVGSEVEADDVAVMIFAPTPVQGQMGHRTLTAQQQKRFGREFSVFQFDLKAGQPLRISLQSVAASQSAA